jgi:hypothetical protein
MMTTSARECRATSAHQSSAPSQFTRRNRVKPQALSHDLEKFCVKYAFATGRPLSKRAGPPDSLDYQSKVGFMQSQYSEEFTAAIIGPELASSSGTKCHRRM